MPCSCCSIRASEPGMLGMTGGLALPVDSRLGAILKKSSATKSWPEIMLPVRSWARRPPLTNALIPFLERHLAGLFDVDLAQAIQVQLDVDDHLHDALRLIDFAADPGDLADIDAAEVDRGAIDSARAPIR